MQVAFPDYTLWGLPGKLKPWPQLRLDLLHKARLPWADKAPLLFGSGVVNSYHNSIGVRTRHRLRECGGPRLRLHFHRLYYERFYSTEEHCRYKCAPPSPSPRRHVATSRPRRQVPAARAGLARAVARPHEAHQRAAQPLLPPPRRRPTCPPGRCPGSGRSCTAWARLSQRPS